MIAVLCIQVQASSIVPSLGAVLVSGHAPCQAALEAALSLITEKLDTGPYTSFPYHTTEGRNIPLQRTKIQIWANNSPSQNTWLAILPSQQSSFTCSFLLCLSETLKSFLHACTPERRTRALVHLFNQHKHGQALQTKKHILQKKCSGTGNVGSRFERWRK